MHIPASTYRVQLRKEFGFEALERIVDYLSALGIGDIYASPITRARSGSSHGYDVVDPGELNPELGSADVFGRLMEKVRGMGMGWLQDVVPNHMAYDKENRFLMDVFENGPDSEFYEFFDIEWNHPYPTLRGRVLAPFLGPHYGEALQNGEIRLSFEKGSFWVSYFDHRFPLRVGSYETILARVQRQIRDRLEGRDPDYLKLLGVIYTVRNLGAAESREERSNQVVFVKAVLEELYEKNGFIRTSLDRTLELFAPKAPTPQSLALLDQLLSEQHFRFAHWRVASEEINYRRFFTVNDLISVRVEREDVFARLHNLILRLVGEGKITGMRIDHIDGLYRPKAYLQTLRAAVPDTYTVVEKILGFGKEELPKDWPVEGTTGYDFLAMVTQLFCPQESAGAFTRCYGDFIRQEERYGRLLREKKRFVIGRRLAGDLDRIALMMHSLCARLWFGPDVTIYAIRRALVEALSCFPVYRSYVDTEGPSPEDRRWIDEAIQTAEENLPQLKTELEFIRRFLLGEMPHELAEEDRAQALDFVRRFQQLSGPLMAKGLEDCQFYVYNRLLALNEVGSDPSCFGIGSEEFHRFLRDRWLRWPHALNATMTHDAKRGEDARARLNVLAELPEEWMFLLDRWKKINSERKPKIGELPVPDENAEYAIYQALLGSWPWRSEELEGFRVRFKEYFVKASREARSFSGWQNPNRLYEEQCCAFLDRILDWEEGKEFLAAFLPFQQKVARYGVYNSLSQLVLKAGAPGVPDFYQGTELWDLSFVDPDNRRLVDFDLRKKLLAEIRERGGQPAYRKEILEHPEDGRIKLYLTHKALQARKLLPELFRSGSYEPLSFSGPQAEHAFGFLRAWGTQHLAIIVPRFVTKLCSPESAPIGASTWGETSADLPDSLSGSWQCALTGKERRWEGRIPLEEALEELPVALWVSGA
ncbi:(1-_4)-alpha-D-glucan 1-alpha-D-glucosylmutase [Methylacidimicrobium cyclopophantes]|uniref:(1->4)-alpha-D-glucan 1-alpha-D-glucosylmutase n=1 Tax=Methylacidimicrobium cyclopophantes TaxID=1041766 RepID=A0A5E6MBZ6_9BACT|nr:malto-oligosyltrehalose synthase [Methylacidimicrobium cyclopophantes]VVM06739.1 (1->4)-alpha-D-glucan 1-alpha-D-glucosylmutase [Methylacidimicrobium cyclopophantes]